eukprot:CAMPEP_0116956678 /NCGR_PEP_ID=MMETSP0467-20121206/43485_1 /TAXON_ID=283647 /ORGANISM="Mesodinium pulex, Strain SPMC105" /LENGTH=43 /DNA_ID= /DNA_START= /DNA_END= /DNA_ORIENTATION=
MAEGGQLPPAPPRSPCAAPRRAERRAPDTRARHNLVQLAATRR